jgi:hypothetical protein
MMKACSITGNVMEHAGNKFNKKKCPLQHYSREYHPDMCAEARIRRLTKKI